MKRTIRNENSGELTARTIFLIAGSRAMGQAKVLLIARPRTRARSRTAISRPAGAPVAWTTSVKRSRSRVWTNACRASAMWAKPRPGTTGVRDRPRPGRSTATT